MKRIKSGPDYKDSRMILKRWSVIGVTRPKTGTTVAPDLEKFSACQPMLESVRKCPKKERGMRRVILASSITAALAFAILTFVVIWKNMHVSNQTNEIEQNGEVYLSDSKTTIKVSEENGYVRFVLDENTPYTITGAFRYGHTFRAGDELSSKYIRFDRGEEPGKIKVTILKETPDEAIEPIEHIDHAL